MRREALTLLQAEYATSKKRKTETLHVMWSDIMIEYQTDNVWDLLDFIERAVSLEGSESGQSMARLTEPDSYQSQYFAQYPMINLLCRRIAALLSLKEPEFSIENENPSDEAVAWLLEEHMRSLLRRLKFRTLAKQLVLDNCLFGTEICKVGYGSRYIYGEEPWAGKIPKGTDIPDDEDEWPYGPRTEYGYGVFEDDMPNIIRIRPHDIFVNPGARVREEIRRIYHRSTRYLIDVWHDERLERDAREQCRGTTPKGLESTFPDANDWELAAESQKVDVVECLDLASFQYCVFAEGISTPLRDWQMVPFDVKEVYHWFSLIDNPESVWGIPYAKLLMPSAKAKNLIRGRILDSFDREGKRVRLWDAGIGDEKFRIDLANAEDGANMQVDGWPQDGLASHYHEIDFGGANPELFKLQDGFDWDASVISGLDDPTRNVWKPGSKATATEIATRSNQQEVSLEAFRENFEMHLEEVIADLCRILLQTWDADQMVKVVGDDPRVFFWVPVERNRILGDFRLQVHAGSTEKHDKATYRRQLTEVLPRIVELAQQIDMEAMTAAQTGVQSSVNRTALLEEVLAAFDKRIADKILRRKDPLDLFRRLITQHHFDPTKIVASQAFIQKFQQTPMAPGAAPSQSPQPSGQLAAPGAPPIASFEERNRIPNPTATQFGRFPMDSTSGRELSETMRR